MIMSNFQNFPLDECGIFLWNQVAAPLKKICHIHFHLNNKTPPHPATHSFTVTWTHDTFDFKGHVLDLTRTLTDTLSRNYELNKRLAL